MLDQKGAVPLLILVAVIGVIAILGITAIAPFRNTLLSTLFPKQFSFAVGNGSMGLLPQITAPTGSTFTTPIMFDTAGQEIDGVDIDISFDKSILRLTNLLIHPQNSNLEYVHGNTPFDIAQVISQSNSTGRFAISGIGSVEKGFNGSLGQSNPFATLEFEVLSNAPTTVAFNFTPGSTIDSNLVNRETEDILAIFTNMNVNMPPPITYPELSPNPSPKPGDIDGDNKVNIYDYNTLLTNFGNIGTNLPGDLDNSGEVDIYDYNLLLTNFN